ncbi:MAG: DUF167 domain-containing protein [Alphaproteobacteria bacterium]|nr:DUF167 domain-containing protein [Alphaproteobacteria bacterium]
MPRAGADRIMGFETDARGQRVLKVAVTAPPVDGAANQALIALLAKRLKVPKSSVSLVAGASARIKRLAVAADADLARLEPDARAPGAHENTRAPGAHENT